MWSAEWVPEFGPYVAPPTAGVAVFGARDFFIAFNVVLDSDDLGLARSIAREVRGASGGLAAVRALGLPLERRGSVQVSMNLLDFEQTPPLRAFALVRDLAGKAGVEVLGGEFVGLVPRAAVEGVEPAQIGLEALAPERILENALEAAGLPEIGEIGGQAT